jgi:hypothetical protein
MKNTEKTREREKKNKRENKEFYFRSHPVHKF